MRPEPAENLDPKALSLWRVHAALRTLTHAVLLGAIALSLALTVQVSGIVFALLLGAFAAYGLVGIVIIPPIRYKYWRYQVDQNVLDMQSGVFVIRRTLVPLIRVQNVDSVQGPVSKYFGLSSVTVSTAASTHEIPALSDESAAALRDHISKLAQEARESF